jgi:hypothetical protein
VARESCARTIPNGATMLGNGTPTTKRWKLSLGTAVTLALLVPVPVFALSFGAWTVATSPAEQNATWSFNSATEALTIGTTLPSATFQTQTVNIELTSTVTLSNETLQAAATYNYASLPGNNTYQVTIGTLPTADFSLPNGNPNNMFFTSAMSGPFTVTVLFNVNTEWINTASSLTTLTFSNIPN